MRNIDSNWLVFGGLVNVKNLTAVRNFEVYHNRREKESHGKSQSWPSEPLEMCTYERVVSTLNRGYECPLFFLASSGYQGSADIDAAPQAHLPTTDYG